MVCIGLVILSNVTLARNKEIGNFLFKNSESANWQIVENGHNSLNNHHLNPAVLVASPRSWQDLPDSSQEEIKEEILPLASLQGVALLNSFNPLTTISQEPREETIIYIVQQGDNPSTIAASFGLTTNTILWANELKAWDYIRPGDKLTILPVSGVLHKVKSGETVEKIAKEYRADTAKIIEFNGLPADGKIEIAQELIIPDGVIFTPARPQVYASLYQGAIKQGHRFPWGQCTWYVATRRYVPWGGHAKQWLTNARAYGFETGFVPVVGAIVVTPEGAPWGHVAYVEKVTEDKIVISETNHIGLGIKSVRVLPRNSRLIRGYIY